MFNKLTNINLSKNAVIFIAGAVFVLMFLKQCDSISDLKVELENTVKVADRNYNNLLASQDSVDTYKNENDRLVSEIRSYEFNVTTAASEYKSLQKKYKNVLSKNRDLKNINSLISTNLNIKDSIINASVGIAQDSSGITVKFDDKKEWDKYNWRVFNGELKLKKVDTTYSIFSSRFNFNQGISLQTAIIEEDGRSLLRITTPYSGVNFTNIENINLVNDRLNQKQVKKAGWSIGFGVGYGINLNNNQVISTGPSIGVGLFYSPKWLRF